MQDSLTFAEAQRLFANSLPYLKEVWKSRANHQRRDIYKKDGTLTKAGLDDQAAFFVGAVATIDALHGDTAQSVMPMSLWIRIFRGEDVTAEQ